MVCSEWNIPSVQQWNRGVGQSQRQTADRRASAKQRGGFTIWRKINLFFNYVNEQKVLIGTFGEWVFFLPLLDPFVWIEVGSALLDMRWLFTEVLWLYLLIASVFLPPRLRLPGSLRCFRSLNFQNPHLLWKLAYLPHIIDLVWVNDILSPPKKWRKVFEYFELSIN